MFQTHSSEIEFERCEILVRSEYGDEKVGEEIISRGDLKKRFKVEEMSSISTLEVAWENKSLWPSGGRNIFLLESC